MEIGIDNSYLFLLCIGAIAFIYGSVGHGGATGYLALMAIFNFTPSLMKPTALVLNLIVSSIAFYHYSQAGSFKAKIFTRFAITSIPMSFLGGYINVNPALYKIILGGLLLISVIRLLPYNAKLNGTTKELPAPAGLIFGAIIGFFSGLIGIGGGIILSPLIVLFKWGNIKEAAAVSALFIFVNSAAGISGQLINDAQISPTIPILIFVVLIGGFMGSYLGSKKTSSTALKFLLCLVLLFASVKLLIV